MFNIKEILSVSLILFSVIDVIGSIPAILSIKQKEGTIKAEKATLASGIIMFAFLFLGQNILKLFGVDVESFAIAGGFILFLIGCEMVLGVRIFREQTTSGTSSSSIVPLAFPLLAGAGTMTTLISLRSAYQMPNILVGIVVNLFFVYLVLRSSDWIERKLGAGGEGVLRKVFGVILLAIAIKLIKTNVHFQ